jgi:CheY-like chemotaxis protein
MARWGLPIAGALWLLMMVLLWWGYDASRTLALAAGPDHSDALHALAGWQGWALVAGLLAGLAAGAVLMPPRASGAAAPVEPASPPEPLTVEPGPRPLRILVAEDAPAAQIVLQRMVEAMGHQARGCDNGALAVEAVQNGDVDLVLMDVHMPVMDGLEAAKAIRALARPMGSVPIVGLTADGLPETRARALSAGMDAFLSKPVNREALEEVLDWLPRPQH